MCRYRRDHIRTPHTKLIASRCLHFPIMSRYDSLDAQSNNFGASDTFLSRVFGLHSVYNQLHDNYQLYEPELSAPLSPQNSPSLNASAASHHSRGSRADKNLLDSELDLEFSSDSDTPLSPLLENADPQAFLSRAPPEPGVGQKPFPELFSANNQPNPVPKLTFRLPLNDANVTSERDLEAGLPLHHTPETVSYRRNSENPAGGNIRWRGSRNRVFIPSKERALYLWANIVNMDEFLIDIYFYYRGKGFANIVAGRVVDILTLVFVLCFTTFLKWGIDYDYFFNHWTSNSETNLTLGDLIIPNFFFAKVPSPIKVFLFGFACYISLRLIQLYFDYKYKLAELQNFYKHLLNISNDIELMTISWSTIVERLMLLKDYNSLTSTAPNAPPHYITDLNSKVRLNAHDIANRIMRKENYMIAIINKNVLDLGIPVPSVLSGIFTSKSVLTRTLEWNLKLCINNFIFNENGQISPSILKESARNQNSQDLSARFKMAAIINLLLCPFIVVYFVLLNFFRYFNEYKSNPSSLLGLRQYTPWAEWKLREFNELPHFFIKRLHLSIGPANTYINQFPGGVLIMNLMSFVNFVSGAILAVLVLMAVFFEDEEHNFWSFEITENRSTLFYISVFGSIWAVTANSLSASTTSNSAENANTQGVSFFYDPEASLRYVSQFTHYLPSSWNRRLHTVEVKNEFCELYSLKILIILNEILSLILTPFVLWFKVSNNSSAIIDFFREYTIHVDGLGYVCYFAMFNFEEKDKNMMYDLNKRKKAAASKQGSNASRTKTKHVDSDDTSDSDSDPDLGNYYQDDKMIKSYMYFLESYGKSTETKGNAGISGSSRAARKAPPRNVTAVAKDVSLYGGSPLESIYESVHREAENEMRPKKKGVLGMINQFSKQGLGG